MLQPGQSRKDLVRWTLWSFYRSLLCGMLVGMALCEMPPLALLVGAACAALVPAFASSLDTRRGKRVTKESFGSLVFMTYVEMALMLSGAMATVAWLPSDYLLNVVVLLVGLLPVAFSWRAHTLVSRSVFGIGARLDSRFSKTLPVTPFWANVMRPVDNLAFVTLLTSIVAALVAGTLPGPGADVSPMAISLAIAMMVAWVAIYSAVSSVGREWTIDWDKAGREMHTMPAWID